MKMAHAILTVASHGRDAPMDRCVSWRLSAERQALSAARGRSPAC
ncbi:MAG TPA: hypothetical protein VFI41_02125 [Gemmatimonadales bacterium]|nr:hypothetical protein [Gemmatimonadales bacterium]